LGFLFQRVYCHSEEKNPVATIYILQSGRTEWSDVGRFESTVGVPLTEAGAAAVREILEELRGRGIAAVYSSSEPAECQTAQIAKRVCREELRDVDYGLWQGLLVEEVRHRYAKAYRQWREAPADGRPPGGESFAEAQERLAEVVGRIAKRHKDKSGLLVLKPIAAALLKCRLAGQDLSTIWQHVEWPAAWTAYNINGSPPEGSP
jgi:probable phosphoglycerate mutase